LAPPASSTQPAAIALTILENIVSLPLRSFAEPNTIFQGERRRFSVMGESPTMQCHIEGELARR
jgi:hypothetical protein